MSSRLNENFLETFFASSYNLSGYEVIRFSFIGADWFITRLFKFSRGHPLLVS